MVNVPANGQSSGQIAKKNDPTMMRENSMTMADMEKVPGGDLKHCMKMISIIPFLWRCYIEPVIVKDHHGHLAAKMQGLAVSPVKALAEG